MARQFRSPIPWFGGKSVLAPRLLPLIPAHQTYVEAFGGGAIECRDWRDIVKLYDRPNTFFYLDPPYLPSTRKGGGYRCELSEEDHQQLVNVLHTVQGKVMLSGYPSELCDSLRWRKLEWEMTCCAAGRTRATGLLGPGSARQKQSRTECVWMNYEPPAQRRRTAYH